MEKVIAKMLLTLSFSLVMAFANAEETLFQQAKDNAFDAWSKAKTSAIDIANESSTVADGISDKARTLTENLSESGSNAWLSFKQISLRTTDTLEHLANEVVKLFQQDEASCQKDTLFCFKDK